MRQSPKLRPHPYSILLYMNILNSFCYIRMKQSPKTYNIQGNVEAFIKKNCLKVVERLA